MPISLGEYVPSVLERITSINWKRGFGWFYNLSRDKFRDIPTRVRISKFAFDIVVRWVSTFNCSEKPVQNEMEVPNLTGELSKGTTNIPLGRNLWARRLSQQEDLLIVLCNFEMIILWPKRASSRSFFKARSGFLKLTLARITGHCVRRIVRRSLHSPKADMRLAF